METKIGLCEMKNKFPVLLKQVKSNNSFNITNRGEAVADLMPSKRARTKDKAATLDKLKSFMLANPVRGVNIKKLIEEGRD